MRNTLFYFILICGKLVNAQVSFCPATPYGAGAFTEDITCADFDGDGKPDLAVVNVGGNNISVLLGTGTGTFGTATNFSVGNSPFSIISADFNGDSKPDLAVANYNSNNVSILLNTGGGIFGSAINYPVGVAPFCVTSSDFNADGKKDLAVTNRNSNNVSILMGTGTVGAFAPAVNFTVGTNPMSVVSSDFDGDTKADLAVANYSANYVSILLGTGTGSFVATASVGAGTNPTSITSADFNGDSKADLAVANYNSNNVSILIGTGIGTFASPTSFTAGTNPGGVISADFNGDAKADLAVGNVTSSDISILLGTGLGTFSTATNFYAGTTPGSVTSADFNGDSKPDLAAGNSGTVKLSVLLNGAPVVSISGITNICAGNNTTLTASGAATYQWSADAGNATTAAVVVSPTSNTSYTVIGNSGVCTGTVVANVTVNSLPIVTANANPTPVCVGTSVTLTGGGALTYTWSVGVTNGVGFVPSVTQTYTVTGMGGNGCVNTATISANPLPSISISATQSICISNNATLTANGGASYVWSANAGGATTSTVVVTPFSNTTYTVSGTNGFCSASQTISVNGTTGPLAALPTPSDPSCKQFNNGNIITSIMGGTAPFSYLWSTGQSLSSIGGLGAGSYSATVTDANGCTSSFSISLYDHPGADFNFTVDSMTVHFFMKDSVVLDPTVCSSGGFLWDYGNGMTSTIPYSPYVIYANTGTVTACLKCNSLPTACNVCYNIVVPGNYSGGSGVLAINRESKFIIYPNPISVSATLETDRHLQNATLTIYNSFGQQIKQTINISGQSITLYRDGLPSGLYFIQIIQENIIFAPKKLIIADN